MGQRCPPCFFAYRQSIGNTEDRPLCYNIAITAFEIDGGAVGLFQYAKEQEWQEVFNKEKEGNPAKKFPTTRPFAIEQDFPDNSIPHESDGGNKYSDRDSTEPRLDSNVQDDAAKEQRSAQEQPTVHSLLMETDASKVKNAIERKYLKEYQQTANLQLAEQQKPDKLQAELDALPKDKRQTARARFLRDEIIKTKNRLQICQSILTRLETDSPPTYLIQREINPRLAEVQKDAVPQTKAKTTTLPYGQNSEADLAMGNDKEPQEKQHASLAQTGFKRHYGGENVIANSAKGIIIKTGARIVDEYSPEASEHATRYYGLVRSMSTDAEKIAANTGFPIELVAEIKKFVFLDKHDLGGSEPEFFEPDFAMAESWQRLISGKYESHDITLLNHEKYERELMHDGMTQHDAHILASERYNYDMESGDFYGSLRKNKKK